MTWTEEAIHHHVLDCIGIDIVKPVGYQVLIQLYRPSKEDENGFINSEISAHNESLSTMLGRVLRMGPDAFKDSERFPSGCPFSLGDWTIFRGSERQRIRINGYDLAFLNDDRFLAVTTQPYKIKTVFDLQAEFGR